MVSWSADFGLLNSPGVTIIEKKIWMEDAGDDMGNSFHVWINFAVGIHFSAFASSGILYTAVKTVDMVTVSSSWWLVFL